MANQCSSRKPVQGVIHWPAVRAASGAACIMVIVSMAAIWAQKNPAVALCSVGRISNPSYKKSETNSKHETPNEESILSEGISQYPEAIAALSPMPMPEPVPVPLPDPGKGKGSGTGTGKGELGDKTTAGSCQSSNSVLEFARDPMEAARLAREEHKLMFVLHVSGNFEESKFT